MHGLPRSSRRQGNLEVRKGFNGVSLISGEIMFSWHRLPDGYSPLLKDGRKRSGAGSRMRILKRGKRASKDMHERCRNRETSKQARVVD